MAVTFHRTTKLRCTSVLNKPTGVRLCLLVIFGQSQQLNQTKLFRFRNMRYAIVLTAILGVSHGMQQCTDSSDCGIAPTECDISPGIDCLMCCVEGEARRIIFFGTLYNKT